MTSGGEDKADCSVLSCAALFAPALTADRDGRFVKHFDRDRNPSPTLLAAREDRLENWRVLQELAGLR